MEIYLKGKPLHLQVYLFVKRLHTFKCTGKVLVWKLFGARFVAAHMFECAGRWWGAPLKRRKGRPPHKLCCAVEIYLKGKPLHLQMYLFVKCFTHLQMIVLVKSPSGQFSVHDLSWYTRLNVLTGGEVLLWKGVKSSPVTSFAVQWLAIF